ncbi:MAG TPA: glycosyltransferase family 2 protein [Candidatus Anaerostipes avistercoris]|uniref:Glycosyltransferase family 2 protein n=1 Tax=Candidatus Anaerostipes avistercoris TaxID=2838462 RepID=A0A9D2PIF5_9FIRM|nr:glycosyltransferase family 2 protein [uncultured Anaerostipes sp.]HJC50213.1 glycosyltransferase family 2 protein [Candidatus Anaerostipes avistercoris]
MYNAIYAGIVTYNPDIENLKKNIEGIAGQVPIVIIVDNGSENVGAIKNYIKEINNVVMICFGTNKGIAAALNRLMQYGRDSGFQWMLSLDQDSVCPEDYCKNALSILNILPDIGIVGPVIHDRKVGIVGHNPKGEYGIVNTCITSGAFVKISVWEKAGKYDEKMFIDSVDFEFCYRVRQAGYLVIQSRKLSLDHSIGKGKIVSVGPFKKKIKEHSAFRCFYIARNNIYYPRKHKLLLYYVRGNYRNFKNILEILFFEKNKLDKICSIFNGWKQGLFMNIKDE